MRRTGVVVAATLAATVALAVAGCSSSGTNANPGSSGTGPAATPATSGTVTWWGWTPDTDVAQRYITTFNKQYPDIKVTYKNFENVDFRNSITPALDSGTGPDVFDLAPAGGGPDTYGGYALDLTSLAQGVLGSDWQTKFGGIYTKQLKDSSGHQTALPVGAMAAGGLWYNKQILDQAGVSSPPTDYTSWVADCQKIAAIGKQCLAMGAGGTDTFPTEMYHSIATSVKPGWFVDAATAQNGAKWNDATGVKVLTIIQNMKKDGIIAADVMDNGQYPQADKDFMDQSAAFVQMGYWYTQYAAADRCKTQMQGAGVTNPVCFTQLPMAFPNVGGNDSALFGEADYGLAINSSSKNIAAAQTFVSWVTMNKAGQQVVVNNLDELPALKGVAPDWSSISLQDPTTQKPAIEKLIKDGTETTETRQWQATSDTLNAIVVATQQTFDPQGKSVQQIADTLQASAVASTVGVSK